MPLTRTLKLSLYQLAKAIGLFRLARICTPRSVRILAYHGFSSTDEHLFRPKLFMSAQTFERRMDLIASEGYRVIGLDEAVRRLSTGRVDPDSVVITIDDGFARTLSAAAPALKRHGFAATVYLTTHHMQMQTPVFDVTVGYLCWKARPGQYCFAWPTNDTVLQLDLTDDASRDRTYGDLLELGLAQSDEPSREALAASLAAALQLPGGIAAVGRTFRLLSADEARQLPNHGINFALHTHRHRFPPGDTATCAREIVDNAAALGAMGLRFSRHFCYPSGVLGPGQVEVLQAEGVESGTTCEPGMARSSHHRMRLPRILDGEDVSEIEFEAELCGFGTVLRRVLRRSPTPHALAQR